LVVLIIAILIYKLRKPHDSKTVTEAAEDPMEMEPSSSAALISFDPDNVGRMDKIEEPLGTPKQSEGQVPLGANLSTDLQLSNGRNDRGFAGINFRSREIED
jgi:hypothetical protein